MSDAPHTSGNAGLSLPETIRVCLFDLDGVLVSTAPLHEKAWADAFDEFLRARAEGGDFQPFTEKDFDDHVNGRLRLDGIREFLRSRDITLPEGTDDDPPGSWTVRGLGRRKNQILLGLIQDGGVHSYPGSVDYLRAVRAVGLRTAVVSSSANAPAVLDAAGLTGCLDLTLPGTYAVEHGLRGKPAPDTFLAGARALGVEPGAAAVFEDAVAGVQAGRAGGFGLVVGVDRLGQPEALHAGGADVVVADLGELIR
jgi:HAD superfamily hydrolase (TIGR01509 family)